jgi:hypothetical protein
MPVPMYYVINNASKGFDLRFRILEVHGSQFYVGFLAEDVYFPIKIKIDKGDEIPFVVLSFIIISCNSLIFC